ncbi:transcription termination factor Rho [Candidatus Gottesmanbacteria bacterium]|nr:transcription termination factor Rho [Candidatus Gottesmanbacteria bacterium]
MAVKTYKPTIAKQIDSVEELIGSPVKKAVPVAVVVRSNDFARIVPDINGPTEKVSGVLDIMNEGHGFLRPKFVPSDKDIYISQSQIRKFMLRSGDLVAGQARKPKENERYYGLLKVETVNGIEADKSVARKRFESLTPIYPNKQIVLETATKPLSTRIIDIFSPIGFGQRGLIVSPPKAGKTTILKELANGITANHPKVHLIAALIGERPEEVTDITRSIKGEVFASNFDESPEKQTKIAETALDRAKRLVEIGNDVIILLDSITRLARAYNLCVSPSGRTLSGGFDPAALYPAKHFLGAARNCEEGGSLTIIGTALIDTGSRMDDLIYEEFKGTGNMEVHLVRSLAEKRIYPAIDLEKSGTRSEELLIKEETLKRIITLRRMLGLLGSLDEKSQAMIERLEKTKTNKEFLESLNKG